MSRLRADLLLVLVALIWGFAFVAQKDALAYIGPFTFVAARFAISTIIVFPLAVRERRRAQTRPVQLFTPATTPELLLLCLAFFIAVTLQQVGLVQTSVTNAGFLTGLYVVFVPVICWAVYRQKPPLLIFPAAALSVLGVWLLSGGGAQNHIQINRGDLLVLLCALAFAWQITLIGRIMRRSPAPFRLSCLQYGAVTLLALVAALATEHPDLKSVLAASYPIIYAGVLSGGVAYTLQTVAQQYTPSSNSAIIMSAEAVFAAFAGALLTSDHLSPAGWTGCGFILSAILLVEFGPRLAGRFTKMKNV
jgi:drug/metabolite transporter (DMT)-like permease